MAKTTPKGKTNEEAYATYRHYVEPELRDVAAKKQLQESQFNLDQRFFLMIQVGAWSSRYYRRMEAIDRWKIDNLDPALADKEAKEILVARHRAHNATYRMPKDFTDEQVAMLEYSSVFKLVDISSLADIPSYGPSLISLWADAKAKGLSDEEAADRILDWEYYWPPAWSRDDEQRKKKLPMIDKAVESRLLHRVTWRPTGDLLIPWSSQVDGQHWEVRINDFPDEWMYSLLMDGTPVGDFHDWPKTWNRSAAKVETEVAIPPKLPVAARSAVSINATNMLARYQAGECEAVWREVMALGADIRKPPYAAAAQAVAKETMRRARHNFDLIVQRLRSIDYRFFGDRWHQPTSPEDLEIVAGCERQGLWIPLSLRTSVEELGVISLLGNHPALCPKGFAADPLFIGSEGGFGGLLEEWADTDPQDRTPMLYDLCPDAESKVGILDNSGPGDFLCIQLPNDSADAVLVGEPEERTLVEYLRWSFQWGGFPGWEKGKSPPEKELALLREGLLSI